MTCKCLRKFRNKLSFLYRDIGDYKSAYRFDKILITGEIRSMREIGQTRWPVCLPVMKPRKRSYHSTAECAAENIGAANRQSAYHRNIFSNCGLTGRHTFFLLYNRVKIKQQLKDVQLRNQIAADLHDDIGSSLSSILLLSKMASSNQPDSTVPILQKFQAMRRR